MTTEVLTLNAEEELYGVFHDIAPVMVVYQCIDGDWIPACAVYVRDGNQGHMGDVMELPSCFAGPIEEHRVLLDEARREEVTRNAGG